MSEKTDAIIVLTSGKQDRGTRATLAFSWACTSLALGRTTAIYLTMEGTLWGLKDATKGVRVEGFEPLEVYLEQFIELGGELLVCSPCSEYYCAIGSSVPSGQLIDACTLVGLSTVVGKIEQGTNVVSF